MCGICGFYGFRDDALLERMCIALKHRGPDQSGTHISDNISLGHRRLSIIDLSEKAKQPMTNEDGSLWLVANGEIYNFQKLKSGLEKRGHKFISHSDNEVILHSYEEKGLQCVEDFRGMFSFALWDANKNRLILCRDRLGEKPLYYWRKGSNFIFASEIKALLEANRIQKNVNEEAYYSFLAFQYVPGNETAVKDIYRVPPGHALIIENGRFESKQYWNILDIPMQSRGMEKQMIEEKIEELLLESVKMRLISDVPLGVLLSGGLDSSSVVALMADSLSSNIKTFTVGFGEKGDELKYAKIVSERFGTEHYEFMVRPENLISKLEQIVWYLDEPIADGGAIATFLVSEVLKDQVKVILLGEGADELFCGYSWHKLASPYLGFIPKILKKRLYFYLNTFYRGWQNTPAIYSKFNSLFKIDRDLLSEMFLYEITNVLPNCLLMKVDKMTMANSIEARAPFLDHKLVEFMVTLPPEYKLSNFTGKYILRKIMKKKLPPNIVNRKKRGFLLPLDKWLGGQLREYARSVLTNRNGFSIDAFGKNNILKLFKPHRGLAALECKIIIWRLLIFELWFDQYIKKSSPA